MYFCLKISLLQHQRFWWLCWEFFKMNLKQLHPKVFKSAIYQKQQKMGSDQYRVPQCSTSSKFNGILSFHCFLTDAELRKGLFINIRHDKSHITEKTKKEKKFVAGSVLQVNQPNSPKKMEGGKTGCTCALLNGYSIRQRPRGWERGNLIQVRRRTISQWTSIRIMIMGVNYGGMVVPPQ